MTETMSERANDKRLILGFDAGCFACTDLARRIEERVGREKLAVRSLRDPEMQQWRERALGTAAPWTPTLFEVDGGDVRAWVGWKMGLALSKSLGPIAMWHVMQVLGELRDEVGIRETDIAEPASDGGLEIVSAGMTRG